jgi:ABC-type enterochelin transport system permease subunit
MSLDGHKLAVTSILASASGIAMDSVNVVQTHLQDVTETGQVISIIISIISGVVSLFKLLRKKK